MGKQCYFFCLLLQKTIQRAAKHNCKPIRLIHKLPDEILRYTNEIKSFRNRHPLLALPHDSMYSWNSKDNPVPKKHREYTLKNFDSPEIQKFCQTYQLAFDKSCENPDFHLAILNICRSYARICAARAYLFWQTNQQEKVIPELQKIVENNKKLSKKFPFMIVTLVRLSTTYIWLNNLIQAGPNEMKYAPFYREMLTKMKARKIQIPDESGICLNMLNGIKRNSYGEYIAYAASRMMHAINLNRQLDIKENLKMSSIEKITKLLPADRRPIARILMETQGFPTVIALKCYRAAKGFYPKELSVLIPEYLDNIPLCPFTEKTHQYISDGENFSLTFNDGNIKFGQL